MVQQQLTLDVGGEIGLGIESTFAIRGRVTADVELKRDEQVFVRVVTMDGEIVFQRLATVAGVGLHTRTKGETQWTERAHAIKLAAEGAS